MIADHAGVAFTLAALALAIAYVTALPPECGRDSDNDQLTVLMIATGTSVAAAILLYTRATRRTSAREWIANAVVWGAVVSTLLFGAGALSWVGACTR